MKTKHKIFFLVLLLALGALVLAACAREDGGGAAEPPPVVETPPETGAVATPEPVVEEEEAEEELPRDLGGREVVVGNWWGGWHWETAEPATLAAEARFDDRLYVFERYNFTMWEESLGDWGTIQEIATMSILAGDPAADIFLLDQAWFVNLMNQGLVAPITTVDFSDRSDYTWTVSTVSIATDVNGVVHGWARDIQTGHGVWFNMRLLEEAGIDPYLPFDLQLRGEWTWDAWLDMLHATTRDIGNTGVIDVWGLATFSSNMLGLALSSNNARHIYRDARGRFHNTTNTPEFLEALAFTNNMRHVFQVMMPQPPDTPWNWFDQAFLNGDVAFRTGGSYMAGGFAANTDDPIGFVTFPVGPSNGGFGPRFTGNTNFTVIPATFTPEEVEEIMFAYLMFHRPLPEFRDPDAWKAAAYLVHSSPRNVDETMHLFGRDPYRWEPMWRTIMPGPGFHEGELFSWRMWHEGSDPAVIVEEAQPIVNEAVAEANRIVGIN